MASGSEQNIQGFSDPTFSVDTLSADGDSDTSAEEILYKESSDEFSPFEDTTDDSSEDIASQSTFLAQPSSNTASVKSKSGMLWCRNPPPQAKTPQRNILRKIPGPVRGTVTNFCEDAFKYFISENIISEIVHCTNLEGRRVLGNSWEETTYAEMKAFFGILLLAGAEKNWDVSIRWCFSEELANPLYKGTFSINRFEKLRRFIRFDDTRTREVRKRDDKLAAFRYVWELFLENCRKRLVPDECVTIDEQLYPYRGRCRFLQYIPSKPAKYGIKIFWMCESKSGYALDGEIYIGRQPGEQKSQNVAFQTVVRLSRTLANSSTNITMDNFFTSVPLAEELLKKGITLVGTLRQNKKEIPEELKPNKSKEVYSSQFLFQPNMTLLSYVPKKNKTVILLSTIHNDASVTEDRKKKPQIITYYNETKGGVHVMDQKIRTYSCKRQTRRWPFALWCNVLDVAALNAFILFTHQHPDYQKGMSHKRRLFLFDLAKELIAPYMAQRSNIKVLRRPIKDAMKKCGIDFTKDDMAATTSEVKRKRCYMCDPKIDRKTKQCCAGCEQNICNEHSVIVCSECFL